MSEKKSAVCMGTAKVPHATFENSLGAYAAVAQSGRPAYWQVVLELTVPPMRRGADLPRFFFTWDVWVAIAITVVAFFVAVYYDQAPALALALIVFALSAYIIIQAGLDKRRP
jgi:uncharacterized membrane protein YqaE (UPF0057 family)